MSEAERLYKARSKQGKLTPEQVGTLESDLLRLLNGKRHPKSDALLKQELVQFCGWKRDKIFGPRQFVADCLEALEAQGLIESFIEDTESVGVGTYIKIVYWKVAA